MILVFENGQLGNQIFQYAVLRKEFPSESLILFGFRELQETFSNIDAIFLAPRSKTGKRGMRLTQKLFSQMTRLGLVGKLFEHRTDESYELIQKKSALPGIRILSKAFFQHRSMTEELAVDFDIRPSHLEHAARWRAKNCIARPQGTDVFISVRRGDYLAWPSQEFPAVLPQTWFDRQIDNFRQEMGACNFIIISDDPGYCEKFFGDDDMFVSRNSAKVDFALMRQCSHGILSPSTFAWWGAYFSRMQAGRAASSLYVAPEYWAGHRKSAWHPVGFQSSWITYRPV